MAPVPFASRRSLTAGILLMLGAEACQSEPIKRRRDAGGGEPEPTMDTRPMPQPMDAGGMGGRDAAAPSAMDVRPVDAPAGSDRPPVDAPVASMDAPVARLLIRNPVAADGGMPRCTIAGITNIATFEQVFLQEMGIATKRRNCANRECHGGNYGPSFTGTGVGVKIATTHLGSYHCNGLNMRVIDVDRPDSSLLLWRLFMTDKAVDCSSGDDFMMRRMPVILGMQDMGGEPNSVAARLSTQELDCARWYVHEVARTVKAMAR